MVFLDEDDITSDSLSFLNDHIVSRKLCDPRVRQYSGYLNIAPDSNMFFWFFESRKDPKNSPLTLWLSGGPGYSSMFALFQEVGPCKVKRNMNKSRLSANSWNEATNLLFIDQTYFSLLTDKPLLGPQLIEAMRDTWILCKHNIDECYKTNTTQDCIAANITCWDGYNGIFTQNSDAGLYDIRTKNDIPVPVYKKYLENPLVLESIGVNTTEITNYLELNEEILFRFTDSGELMHSTMSQVEFLLDNNVPIMFFTGDADYICNWLGGNEMAESLKWKRHQEFKNAVFQEWTIGDVKVGEIRKVENL
ncbi:13374_t:CDS:2, partial [Dentiscutata erythropus]